ncbi:MAG TPA: redoxin family protein [Candidatus Dormibacteraeota bacterium]|nr:redoxin family protein [Candidatus Dormibacteraeota bacterium]
MVAAGVALLALVFYVAAPRAQPATGTLVVAVASRASGSLPRSPLMVHGSGQWVSLGDVSGDVPAAPAERDLTAVSLAAGAYDAVRLGGDIQPVSIAVTAGQVEPLLLGVESGHLITGSAYAGNDEVNLGLGELSGKFVAMPDYQLTDQAGMPVDPVTTAGKDIVIAAFNTSCHETCPLYAALFFEIERHMPAGVILAEVTTDPATDTPATLSAYARRIGAPWTFATGSPDALAAFWKPFGVQLAGGDVHTSTLALVDRHGYVRLVYRGVPGVGAVMPPSLITGLSAAGLRELASGGDGWGAPDVLQALATIAGPIQPPSGAGGQAPAFTLTGTDGRQVTLASLAGKPAVINFWATYCPPCRAEMPLLQRLVGQRSDMRLVLVDEGDGGQAARSFLGSVGLRQAALLDSDLSVGHAYGAIAFPTTVFVRADGTIAARHVGQLDEAVLAALLTTLGN